MPIEVLSDDGSNFIEGERELRELLQQINQGKTRTSACETFLEPMAT